MTTNMSKGAGSAPGAARSGRNIRARVIAVTVLVIFLVVFVLLNRHRTSISFVFFSTQSALWVALTVAAALGFVAGFVAGRNRYRR